MIGGAEDRFRDGLEAARATVEEAVGRADGAEGGGEDRAAAMRRERVGRTNAERERAGGGRAPGRWDWAGDDGEGLDELQGRYVEGTDEPDPAAQEVARADGPRGDAGPAIAARPATPALWDGLAALAGRTVRTPKGEPFAVVAVERGAGVAVVPLDGGQRWVVGAAELEAAFAVVAAGEPADRLAPVRLRAAGVEARHPEVVAGLLRALDDCT